MHILPNTLAALLAAVLLAIPAGAQCLPAFTLASTAPNTGQQGVMFDLEPTGGSPLRIESFDIYVSGTGLTYEVWVRPPLQSFAGFQSTMTGWTMLASVQGVNGNGTTSPVPLNLCLGYTLQTGGRTGFYVTTVGGGTHWYFSGSSVGAPWLVDPNLTLYEGHSGTYFNNTISPRKFGGAVHYSFGANILTLSQSGPGVGDLSVSLGNRSSTGFEGYTLLSANTTGMPGTGPAFGLHPDFLTFSILGFPYSPGNPFHFRTTDLGVFPDVPFNAPPGSLTGLSGQTIDFVLFMLNSVGVYDSRSNLVRFTFQ